MKNNNLTADKLRKSILQLAIQGKLVKQNPDDEPASELVKKIYAEKQKLIAEGKIKKDKTESYIYKGDDNRYYEKIGKNDPVDITDDLPFDIPDSWEWIRLKNIGIIGGGFTPQNHELSNKGEIPYFKVSDMNHAKNQKFLKITNLFYIGNKKPFPQNAIVYPKNGGALFTNKKRILSCDSIVDLNTGFFLPNKSIYFDYIYTLFMNIDFKKYYKGTALPTIDKDKFENILVSLPPLAEQQRIVEKIESMEPYLAEYDKIEKQLTKLEIEIKDKLKKSILQYAIQGKLVKQDPNDEPASVLLERIKAEKEQLIKEGKIKRDKNESFIYKGDDKNYYENINGKVVNITEEIPFEIPNNWCWCKIPNVVYFQEGPGILGKDFRTEGVPLIRIAGMNGDYVSLKGCNYLDPIMVRNKWDHFKLNIGDIVISSSASLDKIALVDTEADGAIPYTGLIRFKMGNFLSRNYFIYFIKSPFYIHQINKLKTGDTIKHYGPSHLQKMFIPTPSINEQHKIESKINKLFAFIK